MEPHQNSSLGEALSAVLAALGMAPGVGPVIDALTALAAIGPEMAKLIESDIALFKTGTLTLPELQERFATTRTTFAALAARWQTPPAA